MLPALVYSSGMQFQRYLGYCPQREGLLDLLTGTETLMLQCRLRGVAVTADYIDVLLEIFHLEEIGDHLVGTYRRVVAKDV